MIIELIKFFVQLLICLWGAIFTQTWLRKNYGLSFDWYVIDYKEPRSTEYLESYKRNDNNQNKFIYEHKQSIIKLLSYFILIIMVC